jgi:Tfp pilus assembly protein PilV
VNGLASKQGVSVKASKRDSGVTLVETMIAVLVALIGVFSIGSLIFQATVTNKNQGTEVTRATIYAQDKIEKLLSFGAAGSVNTTTPNFLTCTQGVTTNPGVCDSAATWTISGGTATATSGLTGTGWNTGLIAGGQLTTGNPSAPMQSTCPTAGLSLGYVDYLDYDGSQAPLTAGGCSSLTGSVAYIRMWQISDVAATGGPAMKKVSVAVWSQAAIGQGGAQAKPVVTLTSYMSNPN